MTFGQRLKTYRKQKALTQMELAGAIGVSMQAVSKWETDIGMPDISQIVPLCKELDISSDILLGIVSDENDAEFEELYEKCMEAEKVPACDWPVPAETIEPFFRQMYDYFSLHPNHPRAADYLLDQTELYWEKALFFENETIAIKECERFASCIFRHSDDADLQAKTKYLIASVWARVGQTEKADEILAKMPYQYHDRAYYAAEVMKKARNYTKTEMLCRESFTQGAKLISRNIRLIASLPTKTLEDRIAYDEYMLRIVNAFLSGGDYMPHRQIYQKMSLLSSLIQWHLKIDNITYAERYFCELLDTGEQYLSFLSSGSKGKTLLLLEDDLDIQETDRSIEQKRELVFECFARAVSHGENAKDKSVVIADCIEKTKMIQEKYSK